VQAGAIIGITDIHTRTLANGIQAFENFDRISAIFFWLRDCFGHAIFPGYFRHFIRDLGGDVTRLPQDLVESGRAGDKSWQVVRLSAFGTRLLAGFASGGDISETMKSSEGNDQTNSDQ
jgi:hypothetical protein